MTPLDAALMVIVGLSLGDAQCVASRGLALMAPAGFASGMPMAGALSGVFTPPLWQMLWLLLGLTVGLALHVALLHLLVAMQNILDSPELFAKRKSGEIAND